MNKRWTHTEGETLLSPKSIQQLRDQREKKQKEKNGHKYCFDAEKKRKREKEIMREIQNGFLIRELTAT